MRVNHHGGKPDVEKNDPVPMEMPAGTFRPKPLEQIMAEMIRQHAQQEELEGYETLDEANDFDEEDPDTLDFMTSYTLQELEDEPLATATEVDPPEERKEADEPLNQSDDPPESDERPDEAG